MGSELVLSFVLDPEDVRSLQGLSVLRGRTRGRATTRNITRIHYDTPNHAWRARGLTLAVEREGGGHRQWATLVRRPFGPATEHLKLNGPLLTPDPAPGALEHADVRAVLTQAAADGSPEPVFTAKVKRTLRHLDLDDGAAGEARLEVGHLLADGLETPVHRFDLVLTKGDPRALFGLTRQVAATARLHFTYHRLEDQGYELATGTPPAWFKKKGLDLPGDASVEEAMIRMLRAGLDHALSNQAAVLESDHPEGIHQMRVGLRRTRSALRLFRKYLPADQYAWLAGEVKWLTNQLGPARDMDVFEDEVAAPVAQHVTDAEAFKTLLTRVRNRRTRCRAAARRAVRSERAQALMLDVGAWLAEKRWRENGTHADMDGPVTELACKLIAKRHKKVRKDGERFDSLSIEERHLLRIDVKKLRYAIDFFGTLYDKKHVDRYLEALSGLQDSLGYLNDVAVAEELVEALCRGTKGLTLEHCRFAGGMVIGWHARTMADIEDHLSADVKTFLAGKPFWKAH